tara:strand:- start:2669 stop:4507 length:1839 start_codon:yes stop_codon:yes gene_type:complete
MYILGISSWFHDSSACLICDGKILAAVQEERFTRIKHDDSFPKNSILFCLEEAGIAASDLDSIVFYEKPLLKFERLLETYIAYAPKGFKSFLLAMPIWLRDKLFQKRMIVNELQQLFGKDFNSRDKILFSNHHLSHAASAFFPSPFKKSAVLTLDAVGEWATTSMAIGNGNKLDVIKEIHFPHSLGMLYSAFTYYTGFKVNSGEYKVMGLAPYGKPLYVDLIKDNLIDIKDDGSFFINMKYFDYCAGLTMTNKNFNNLFDGLPRSPESPLTQREMDLAASIQKVTEEIVIKLAKDIALETGETNLCLAGGVALNCVANGALLKEGIFKNIWIQPAAGDAGGALGAALAIHYLKNKSSREIISNDDAMRGSYLGPSYNDEQIESKLKNLGGVFKKLDEKSIIKNTAKYLAEGKAIGWMQGKMEFGPRALGARSIIADPRSPKMQKQLNLKVKFRESFRPFAPSILYEEVSKWFELKEPSPYMLLVSKVNQGKLLNTSASSSSLFGIDKLNEIRSVVPAITHIDNSARVQTVHSDTNPRYHSLIKAFQELTDCPIIVNTSFNVRGEPIVCSPEDAFKCFMGTELDILIIENYLLIKADQDIRNIEDYKNKYELD